MSQNFLPFHPIWILTEFLSNFKEHRNGRLLKCFRVEEKILEEEIDPDKHQNLLKKAASEL